MKILIAYITVMLALLVPVSFAADAPDRFDVPAGDCPSDGPEKAPVTILEFIDYQ